MSASGPGVASAATVLHRVGVSTVKVQSASARSPRWKRGSAGKDGYGDDKCQSLLTDYQDEVGASASDWAAAAATEAVTAPTGGDQSEVAVLTVAASNATVAAAGTYSGVSDNCVVVD